MAYDLKKIDFSEPYIDDEEKEIMENLKNHPEEWISVKEKQKKEERINIRLSTKDLEGIKQYAELEGIPYQTLISSIIHKFLNGRLKIN
jgi:predicted DNA binding CopG/RHH family protein